jgi:beta-glucosidase
MSETPKFLRKVIMILTNKKNLSLAAKTFALLSVAACQPTETSEQTSDVSSFTQVALSTRTVEVIEDQGFQFRDLNKNGVLDAYEDWRLSAQQRAADLLSKMTLAEKAGQIAHGNIFESESNSYEFGYLGYVMNSQHITAYIPFLSLDYQNFATQNNKVQEMAEAQRLGIPATISTDPRHHFTALLGASATGEGYSAWPEPLGFAALDEPQLTEQFAEIAAAEYRATGFNQALSPQADLPTEPRWPRIYHTFGEDPEVAGRMVAAYIRGFQGGSDGPQVGKVSSVVKHWVGYGAAKDGLDSHNYYGRYADLKEQDLATHITPFEHAFSAGVSGVMPAYSIFEGLSVEGKEAGSMGAAYSELLINDLLREKYNYQGVVLSDWAVTHDCSEVCKNGAAPGEKPNPETDISTAWGVEHLSKAQRFALAMKVGVDQFGGVTDVAPILEAVEQGLITEQRLDQSVLRILQKTFALGLFESPFVDVEAAAGIVNTPKANELGQLTQSRSMVLLKKDVDGALLDAGNKLFLVNASADVFEQADYAVVDDMSSADVAIVRLSTPYETLHPNYYFGSEQHEGRLGFDPEGSELATLRKLKDAGVRVIVDVSLDRPAVLTGIIDYADILLVNFGANDQALLSVLDGSVTAEGKLPFELPSSMAAVEAQDSGKPADSQAPLFPLHFSLNN